MTLRVDYKVQMYCQLKFQMDTESWGKFVEIRKLNFR